MAGEHKNEAAQLLADADDFDIRTQAMARNTLVTEALVHAVLHLAEVVEVRETILHGN